MGVFSRLKNEKLDPCFCISCDLKTGFMRLPLEMTEDPFPEFKLTARMEVGSGKTAKIFVRAKTAKISKALARKHLNAYLATRTSKNRMAA